MGTNQIVVQDSGTASEPFGIRPSSDCWDCLLALRFTGPDLDPRAVPVQASTRDFPTPGAMPARQKKLLSIDMNLHGDPGKLAEVFNTSLASGAWSCLTDRGDANRS